ncbi:MAG: glycosyltransferase family 4 protein [Chitinophagales bacterium]|nr:glycosyltransferase family 4 protein [Chitinophagales bacterium]
MAKNPEILFISNYWKKSQGGGISTYLINLVEALKKRGIGIRVLSRHGIDPEQTILSCSKLFFVIKTLRLLRQQAGVPIVTSNDWYCLLPALIHKWIYRQQVVHIFHTWPEEKMNKPLRWLMKYLTRRCDQLLFVSEALREYYSRDEGIDCRHSMIMHAGFPTPIIQPEKEKVEFLRKFGIDKKDIILCSQAMTAHREKARGLALLINVMKNLNQRRTVHLLVTKDGKYRASLEKQVRSMGLQHRVHFTGDMENVYLPLSVSDLYLHITYAEGGVSLSILEAISKDIPVIATSIGGIKELLRNEETGLLVEPSPTAIQQAIESLIHDPDKARNISHQAKEKLTPLFDWNKNAAMLLSFLFPEEEFPLTIPSPKVHNKVM